MSFGVTKRTTRAKSNKKIIGIKNLPIITIALPGELKRNKAELARGEQVKGCFAPIRQSSRGALPSHVAPLQPWTSSDTISAGKLLNQVLNALLFWGTLCQPFFYEEKWLPIIWFSKRHFKFTKDWGYLDLDFKLIQNLYKSWTEPNRAFKQLY